jgi:hypothetical protein
MRQSRLAVADMPITERTRPDTGAVNGTAVAINGTLLAVATSPNSFVVLELDSSAARLVVGANVRIRFSRGHATVETERGLGR